MLGPYGDLKLSAARPGPGSYEVPSVASQIGGKFGSAQRAMTKDYAETMNYAAAINKASARPPSPSPIVPLTKCALPVSITGLADTPPLVYLRAGARLHAAACPRRRCSG